MLRAVTKTARQKPVHLDEIVDRVDRGAVLLQPALFLLGFDDGPEPAVERVGNVDIQALGLDEQLGINE